MKYINPWQSARKFINLGEYINTYDLYALVAPNSISFGARYSNEPEDYLSGEAIINKSTGYWTLIVSGPTAVAAARYFANKHEDI